MDTSRLNDINSIAEFLEHTKKLTLKIENIEDKYAFIFGVLNQFKYRKLVKKDKRVIIKYLKRVTGYKKAQIHRLVKRGLKGNLLRKKYVRDNPNLIYRPYDIKLLEKTDELHLRLSSLATKEILRREYEIFCNEEFKNISNVSHSHINNLRKTNLYKNAWVNPTKPRVVPIGITQKPETNNMPGSIRVDTVHQNNVYHINSVDEITQWEVVVCVPQITEEFLEPALCDILLGFPFVVFNFHSDRGSEFINKMVARILNKLLIKQTKSRSRHCNDNALVESKNGSVVRKNLGYFYVDQSMADTISIFDKNYLNLYLNYHRPSLFQTETIVDRKGKERKLYGQATTPYEKLKELAEEQNTSFLRDGISFKELDKIAYEKSDNEFAKILREEQRKLLETNQKLVLISQT